MRRIITRFEPKRARRIGFVSEIPPLSREDRLDVYATAWFLRLEESMLDDYEAIGRALGERKFATALRDYFRVHPSHSYTLAKTGDAFPEFLKKWKNSARRAWFYDLACLERSFYRAFLARDPRPWSVSDLQTLSPKRMERVRLETEPSVSIHRSRWKIHEMWKGSALRPALGQTYLLVYRRGFDARVSEISHDQFRALRLAQGGCRLEDWLESCGGERSIPWLTEWAGNGVLRPV